MRNNDMTRFVTIATLNRKAYSTTTFAEIKLEQVTGLEPATFSLGSFFKGTFVSCLSMGGCEGVKRNSHNQL